MSILDISKTLMYDFHYNTIKPMYGDRAKLLFTNTNSLCYEIKTDDFHKDIVGIVETKFDTSEYPIDHPAVSEAGFKVGLNKKVIGMFKDESNGTQIAEFVGLRAKCCAYTVDGKECKKDKIIKKVVVKNHLTVKDYVDMAYSHEPQIRIQTVLRSHRHEMYTEVVNKSALSANDDKNSFNA